MSAEGTIAEVLAGTARWCVVEGDCLDVLSAIDPRACVLVTDPPYGIAHASGRAGPWKDSVIAGDASAADRDAVLAWHGVGPAIVFGSWKVTRPTPTREVLIWDKGPASGMGDLSFPWKRSWEEIYVIGGGFKGHRDEGVLRGHTVVTWASKGREHPNSKPVTLMRHLVAKCPAGVVIDPFCGSGTTGVAALAEGRRFIGIEKDPGYAAIARERLRAEVDSSTLQAVRAGQVPMFGGKP